MRRWLRRGLIGMLAVALMVAGLPVAHAQNCDMVRVEPAPHAHHRDMRMDHAVVMDHAPQPPHEGAAPTPCKCLNCSSLCAAFVPPLPPLVKIERRVDAIVYAERVAVQRETAIFIDPGIPIAA